MLAYILALAVGLGSLAIYLAAFFVPEVHRKIDFYWSGVGLFYALMLWVCAGRLTGGVLLGQIAAVSLVGWFCWQTLTLRRQMVPAEQQTELPTSAELQSKLDGLLVTVKDKIQGMQGGKTKSKKATVAKTAPSPAVPTAVTGEAAPAVVPTEVVTDEAAEHETMVTEPTVATPPSPFEAIANPESPSENSPTQNIPPSPPPQAEPEKPTDSL